LDLSEYFLTSCALSLAALLALLQEDLLVEVVSVEGLLVAVVPVVIIDFEKKGVR
jgi:hypothetical protein